MTEYTPTVVAMYNLGNTEDRPIAEFRLSANGRVELIILNKEQPYAAQWLYEDGVELVGERRTVWPDDDGPAYMRALLRARTSSYMVLRDESPQSSG
ncbi:hypothetical protein ACFWF7_03715 [Nocardia sp. NPDC060256]|uniref:hypothetical protein n=1 Tax=unclassified Nocardia TaxID=2637762 RepID=UPI00365764F2